MSQRVIYKSPAPNNPMSRGKGPIHLSPRSKLKQQNKYKQEDSSLTPPKNNYLTETITSNENVLKGAQQHPLEFSSNRKHKSKQIQPCPSLNPINSFMGPSVYARHLGNNQFQNAKFSNENQNTQASLTNFSNKFQVIEIQKLRNYYQNEVRALRDSQIFMQEDFNQKYREVEKQKNCWREKYAKIKQDFLEYKKGIQQKEKLKSNANTKQIIQQYGFTLNRYNNNKPNVAATNENIINLQQQIQNVNKSLKVAENQIYGLNKLKAELNYQIAKLTEDNKKANIKIFELEYHIEKQSRSINQLNQKIKKAEETNLAKSLNLKPESLSDSIDPRILSSNQNINLQKPAQMQDRGSQRSHSSSSTRSRSSSSSLSSSLSVSSKHKSSSKHHRSNSNNVHGGSSHHRSHANNLPPQLMHMHINFDFNKQIDKLKYACRKLEKTVVNQNQQIMMDGLKRLNAKYEHFNENQAENCPKIYQQYQYYNRGNFSNQSRIGGQSNLHSICQPHELNQSTKATYDSKPNRYW